MIKVYFNDRSYWATNGCSCCEPYYYADLVFSFITGVKCPADFESHKYEMYNGSKSDELECLISVLWDLVADKSKYKDFDSFAEEFQGVEESEIKLMLLVKNIEVVFLED